MLHFSLFLVLSLLGCCHAGNEGEIAVEENTHEGVLGTCVDFSDASATEDSMFDPIQDDVDSVGDERQHPPATTLEDGLVAAMAMCDNEEEEDCEENTSEHVDRHWGSDPEVLKMRDRLRQPDAERPPIFLVPGLAASRLVSWKHKECRQKPLMSPIRVQDYVWLNLNLIMQVGTIDERCFVECIKLGINQTDTSETLDDGCKLRPDEGLDAISSLSVGGIQSQLMVGRTNTVYSWLIQWLSDNLGYDVGSIVGFPYDWRLSPDKLEERDGFFTFMRRRIETAVETNGVPGVLVAHSMGNLVFRYFLSWLKVEFTKEAYIDELERSKMVQLIKQSVEGDAKVRSPYRRRQKIGSLADIEQKRGNTTFWVAVKSTGRERWLRWIDSHIWTYAGLSAPLLGAVNPLRAAISGETMGMPISSETAREMEVTFGSTLTVNPVSTHAAFCDEWEFQEWDEEPERPGDDKKLLCLEDLEAEIQSHKSETNDPWRGFEALKSLLHDRIDWDSNFPMIEVVHEDCESNADSFCIKRAEEIRPQDVMNGRVFSYFNELWQEDGDPLHVKYEQLQNSFWGSDVPNPLSESWQRPPIKHVVMGFGTDVPTEVGYSYLKRDDSRESMCKKAGGIPNLQSVLWEVEGGEIVEEPLDSPKGLFSSKPKRKLLGKGSLGHSGDGSVPYLSLAHAHLWLLHDIRENLRANRSSGSNPLERIQASHRPKGGTEWQDGIPDRSNATLGKAKDHLGDTGTMHPHGTRYKPEMQRFYATFTSQTGAEWTTTVLEAFGVEHKETTRNYDILAAVFTDVLKAMHNDTDILGT